MNVQAQRTATTVRDVLVAKAIQNGYNPYCRSTDADARRVTDEMRAKTRNICVPTTLPAGKSEKKPYVREVKPTRRECESSAHREVITIENFDLVRRKSHSVSFAMLVSVMISALVLIMVVYSGSLINDRMHECSDISDSIVLLEEENKALAIELAKKNDLVVIEEIARNDLGMIKVAEAEQRYADLGGVNTVSTYSAESEDSAVTVRMLNTFGEKISNILEYLD